MFTVRGIAATENEANMRDLFSSFFGFIYLRPDSAAVLDVDFDPNRISITLPDGTSQEEIVAAARELTRRVSGWETATTTARMLEENQVELIA